MIQKMRHEDAWLLIRTLLKAIENEEIEVIEMTTELERGLPGRTLTVRYKRSYVYEIPDTDVNIYNTGTAQC